MGALVQAEGELRPASKQCRCVGEMTRDRLRPAVLVRKVLLPPVIIGAAVAGMLGGFAVTAAGGSRADAGNPFSADAGEQRLVIALSADTEGTPGPSDVRRARRPLPERLRSLGRHPYFRLYLLAQRRFGVPWALVASVHYQETGFKHAAAPTPAPARKRYVNGWGVRPARGGQRRAGPSPLDHRLVIEIAAQLRAATAPPDLGPLALRAVARRYGAGAEGRVSTAMVIERARAWRLLGAIPAPGSGELATPAAGVTGGCGYFGCPRPGHLHNGVDFLAPSGTPVHAADGGVVALVQTSGESGGYGNFVCLQHRPHLATCYAHLSTVAAHVREGARVRRGRAIGRVGSTGSSTTPHLHFEVRLGPAACSDCAVDPMPLLSDDVPQDRVPRLLRASAAGGAAGSAAAARDAAAPAPARAREPVAPGSGPPPGVRQGPPVVPARPVAPTRPEAVRPPVPARPGAQPGPRPQPRPGTQPGPGPGAGTRPATGSGGARPSEATAPSAPPAPAPAPPPAAPVQPPPSAQSP